MNQPASDNRDVLKESPEVVQAEENVEGEVDSDKGEDPEKVAQNILGSAKRKGKRIEAVNDSFIMFAESAEDKYEAPEAQKEADDLKEWNYNKKTSVGRFLDRLKERVSTILRDVDQALVSTPPPREINTERLEPRPEIAIEFFTPAEDAALQEALKARVEHYANAVAGKDRAPNAEEMNKTLEQIHDDYIAVGNYDRNVQKLKELEAKLGDSSEADLKTQDSGNRQKLIEDINFYKREIGSKENLIRQIREREESRRTNERKEHIEAAQKLDDANLEPQLELLKTLEEKGPETLSRIAAMEREKVIRSEAKKIADKEEADRKEKSDLDTKHRRSELEKQSDLYLKGLLKETDTKIRGNIKTATNEDYADIKMIGLILAERETGKNTTTQELEEEYEQLVESEDVNNEQARRMEILENVLTERKASKETFANALKTLKTESKPKIDEATEKLLSQCVEDAVDKNIETLRKSLESIKAKQLRDLFRFIKLLEKTIPENKVLEEIATQIEVLLEKRVENKREEIIDSLRTETDQALKDKLRALTKKGDISDEESLTAEVIRAILNQRISDKKQDIKKEILKKMKNEYEQTFKNQRNQIIKDLEELDNNQPATASLDTMTTAPKVEQPKNLEPAKSKKPSKPTKQDQTSISEPTDEDVAKARRSEFFSTLGNARQAEPVGPPASSREEGEPLESNPAAIAAAEALFKSTTATPAETPTAEPQPPASPAEVAQQPVAEPTKETTKPADAEEIAEPTETTEPAKSETVARMTETETDSAYIGDVLGRIQSLKDAESEEDIEEYDMLLNTLERRLSTVEKIETELEIAKALKARDTEIHKLLEDHLKKAKAKAKTK